MILSKTTIIKILQIKIIIVKKVIKILKIFVQQEQLQKLQMIIYCQKIST